MEMIQPKISVLIFTYNQENIISRAIDSALKEREYIFEILISDDCSTDNTFQIIKEYESKYPNLIKAYRNDVNLGIYGNIETLRSRVRGDLFVELAGDDEFCFGYFKQAINLIESMNIDYNNELLCIYFDFMIKYPNGFKRIYKNDLILKKHLNPISLKIRQLINTRGCICSSKIIPMHRKVPKNIGLFCDELLDIQKPLLCNKNYYCNFVGTIYYSHFGVSVKNNFIEFNKSMDATDEILKEWINFSKKDLNWLIFKNYMRKFRLSPSLKNFSLIFLYYFKSIDLRYGIRGLALRRLITDLLKVTSIYGFFSTYLIKK